MARDDVFLVRQASIPAVGEAVADRAVINRFGFQVVVDLFTQLAISGYTFHMQIGTEDAPVASTTSIDDALVWMLADQSVGSALIPLLYEVNIDALTTATKIISMLELDKEKARFSSGGTAFTPENLNGSDAFSFSGSAYVGTDITAAAKTAVPDSVELARLVHSEDVIADPGNGLLSARNTIYSVRERPIAVGIDACSLVAHHGAATADVNSYGILQFAQVPKALITP